MALIDRGLAELGIKRDGNVFDFTPLPNVVAIDFFEFICRSGPFVIHGANSERPYAGLVSQQANDAAKEAGNRKAVYATSDARIALTCAVINRDYIRARLGSYTQGYVVDGPRFIVKATTNLYQLFLERDPRVTADGYVYLLDKRKFTPAGGTTNEYYSEEDQTASRVFKVSKRLGETLLVVGRGGADNVLPFSPEELPPDKQHLSGQKR